LEKGQIAFYTLSGSFSNRKAFIINKLCYILEIFSCLIIISLLNGKKAEGKHMLYNILIRNLGLIYLEHLPKAQKIYAFCVILFS